MITTKLERNKEHKKTRLHLCCPRNPEIHFLRRRQAPKLRRGNDPSSDGTRIQGVLARCGSSFWWPPGDLVVSTTAPLLIVDFENASIT